MKRKLFILIFIFLSTEIFAFEHENRISAGVSVYYDETNIDSSEVYKILTPEFSYEFLFKPFKVLFGNLSAGVSAKFNPFINLYSMSLYTKGYLNDDFSGLFLGISPVSELNFGNLFLEEPFLNYGIGFLFGWNKKMNDFLDFEAAGTVTFSIYDKVTPLKAEIYTFVGYTF